MGFSLGSIGKGIGTGWGSVAGGVGNFMGNLTGPINNTIFGKPMTDVYGMDMNDLQNRQNAIMKNMKTVDASNPWMAQAMKASDQSVQQNIGKLQNQANSSAQTGMTNLALRGGASAGARQNLQGQSAWAAMNNIQKAQDSGSGDRSKILAEGLKQQSSDQQFNAEQSNKTQMDLYKEMMMALAANNASRSMQAYNNRDRGLWGNAMGGLGNGLGG